MSPEWTAWTAAMTAANFRVLFPEFTGASDAKISSRIARALTLTPEDVWGDLYAQGVAWQTAAFLSRDPAAQDMRKGGKPSIYEEHRTFLNRIVSSGFRIAGLP